MINCKCQLDRMIDQAFENVSELEIGGASPSEQNDAEEILNDLHIAWVNAPICSGTPMNVCLSSCTYLSK